VFIVKMASTVVFFRIALSSYWLELFKNVC